MTLNEYITSIKDKKICVIGYGVSNEPLVRLLLTSGCSVTVCDKRSLEEMGAAALQLISQGAKLRLGEDYLENLDYDVIFRTPGLMPFDEHLEKAREKGSVVTSEMEVFFSVCPCKVIAITGSDGKTTTTTIISELLKEAGYTVHLGGNIGRPLLCDAALMKSTDIVVLELSSFQLHSMPCKPNVSVVTNVSPNHLDKHKDYQDYIDAKKYICKMQDENDAVVLNLEDALAGEYADATAAAKRWFSVEKETENGVFAKDGKIYRSKNGEKSEIMNVDEILLPGVHNLKNYCAAFAATDGLVDDGACRKVAMTFKGVEHRLETVRVLNDVTYINDSIGTSPTRTIAGLHALKTKPIVIAGGYDKHIPFDILGEELCINAKAVVLTGATAEKIKESIINAENYKTSPVTFIMAEGFDAAVMTASKMAEAGDIVLLSPACAAFDAFKNFAERGRHFKKLVMEL